MQIQMTPEQFEAARQRIGKELGVQLDGTSGALNHSGVAVDYDFSGSDLTVEIRQKPFYVTTAYVENQITAWFASS